MTATILPFTGLTCVEIPADMVLESGKGKFDLVVIMGYDKDDNMSFYSSTSLLEKLKLHLMTNRDNNV